MKKHSNVRKIYIGVRNRGWENWKRYLIPRRTMPKDHEYFAWFYWWLGFYACRSRKCDICGDPMPSCGGVNQYDENGKSTGAVSCKPCLIEHKLADDWRVNHYKEVCNQCGKCKNVH